MLSVAQDNKRRTADVFCLSSGETIKPEDVAYVVKKHTIHVAECVLAKPGVCPNCLLCSASPKDTVEAEDGGSTSLPWSSCKEACANCRSKEHTVFYCGAVLAPEYLARVKASSVSTSAYTAVQLACIAYKYYKARDKHSLVSAEVDKGMHLRAVLMNYVRYPTLRPTPTSEETNRHSIETHNFDALCSRVRLILGKLFASEVTALGGDKQNVTLGVNYLRELGEWFERRDIPPPGAKQWPEGQRSKFKLVTKSGDEMAAIMVHSAMLRYKSYGVWLFGTAKNKVRNPLVDCYDQSIQNYVTWRNGDLHFLTFDATARITCPQSVLDERAFQREEEERERKVDGNRKFVKQSFRSSRRPTGYGLKLAAWMASGKAEKTTPRLSL